MSAKGGRSNAKSGTKRNHPASACQEAYKKVSALCCVRNDAKRARFWPCFACGGGFAIPLALLAWPAHGQAYPEVALAAELFFSWFSGFRYPAKTVTPKNLFEEPATFPFVSGFMGMFTVLGRRG
jgi:hypothetical protein